jgi:hypothetical protein
MRYPRVLIAIALLALGCSKNIPATGPAYGTELGILIIARPDQGRAPVEFRLSRDEIARLEPYIPDLSRASKHRLCKHGVPDFVIRFYDRGATRPLAEGDFHEPDLLVFEVDGGRRGELRAQQAFHDALVAVIQARGHLK